jgi:hypothetical protein
MLSHTVPRKLLEHFAFDDPVTRSRRLWRYQKGQAPYGRAAPRTATRWDGHFADPANATKEAEVELRLKREFEDPVNQFIDQLCYQTFPFTTTQTRLLAGYLRMLFHRSRARRDASEGQQDIMVASLRALRADENRLAQLAAKYTADLMPTGLGRMVTKEMAIQAIDNRIAEETTPDAAQRRYTATMETMMAFDDPFVIGDAPVVTWERTDQYAIVHGQGFARPNVEAFLPVFPAACLHVLPAVPRNRRVRTPTAEEVNAAQAAFATQHCFTNIRSTELDELLQPEFGIVRLGIDGFSINHLDHAAKLFEILMNQPVYGGPINEGENLPGIDIPL